MTRWSRFAGVGIVGFVLQLVLLRLFTTVFEMHYLVAVILSVEAAILHNFIWHERWTWRDRIDDSSPPAVVGRLMRFNTATGAIALIGNALFTALFVSVAGLPVLPANVAAIACLTALNFVMADRLAWRQVVKSKLTPIVLAILAVLVQPAEANELKRETLAAWDQWVAAVETRVAGETRDGNRFLSIDFRDSQARAKARAQLDRGEILVEHVGNGSVSVPGGTISHWRGYAFIPGITLQDALDAAALRGRYADLRQDDVLAARVLDRDANSLKVFLRLQRKTIVTATYNTEHLVTYQRLGEDRATSRSVSTRIAELSDAGTPREREKPAGQDRGFMWRLHSYWKYHAVTGGVIVELESLTLSRDVPWGIRTLASSVIDRIARESVTRTLTSLRARLQRAV